MSAALCLACGAEIAVGDGRFAEAVQAINGHMLDQHVDIIGTPAADEVEYLSLSTPAWSLLCEPERELAQ